MNQHSTRSPGLSGSPVMERHASRSSRSALRDVQASTSAVPQNGRALSLPSVIAAWGSGWAAVTPP